MLKISSRETFMKNNINNFSGIGKKARHMSLFLFFCLVSVIFAGFPGGYSQTVTAEQGFRLCFFQKTHQPRLSGSCRVRCAGMMMWCSVL